jgi:hypothetical protein
LSRCLLHLEDQYNDGKNHRLEYLTARELYNMIKAAEDSWDGDAETYQNYRLRSSWGGGSLKTQIIIDYTGGVLPYR